MRSEIQKKQRHIGEKPEARVRSIGTFIKEKREAQGITAEQLCEGLCSVRTAWYLEGGEREMNRPLQEAMLERLGIGAEDYERYLDDADYRRWQARQDILHYMAYEKTAEAGELLEQYRREYCGKGYRAGETSAAEYHRMDRNEEFVIDVSVRQERQFYLCMLAQLRRYRGEPPDGQEALYSEALELTVPGAETKPLGELALSLKELNLILEKERCSRIPKPRRYQEVISYIERRGIDSRGTVKIYPKAAYLLCRCVSSREEEGEAGGTGAFVGTEALSGAEAPAETEEAAEAGMSGQKAEWDTEELLRLCNKALEILRRNGRMYYLWEILDMRGKLLDNLRRRLFRQEGGGSRRTDTVGRLLEENQKWKRVLEQLYQEFRISVRIVTDSFLYVEKGVSCINDVIQIRRQMLGMSPKELCEGICDVKTLRRLENHKTSPQRAIVRELFERLGLPGELIRTELVTKSPEARQLMERLRESSNRYRREDMDKLLEQIRELVPMEIKANQQALMRAELNIRRKRGELEKEEYLRLMREALELTLPYEVFLKEGEKYLTKEEQSCIQNMMIAMDEESTELRICMQRFEEMYSHSFFEGELRENAMGMYDFIMGCVESKWGNMGEHDKADYHNQNIIKGCLRFRKLWMLNEGLYDRWWNYAERKKKGIPIKKPLNDAEELTKCIAFSQLEKSGMERFYQKKLGQIIGKG